MIQIITGDYATKEKYKKDNKYCVSDFKNPKDFDEFDINIIDLSFSQFWENRVNSTESINMLQDLKHYKSIIENTNQAKIVVIFPQNICFRYYYSMDKYKYGENLKNLLQLVERLVLQNIYGYSFKLEFATTQTTLKSLLISADFYFPTGCFKAEDVILTSDKSNKITTVRIDSKLYYTTLNLCQSKECLEEFLYKTKILCNYEAQIPEWINEINLLNDLEIKNTIQQIEAEIKEKKEKKEIELKKLEKNNKIKSILYQTDNMLQQQIIAILNELLDYKDDNFIDEKEEDFRIIKDEITFIIETKGLSRNIKGTDVDKTFNHVLMYQEKMEEENKEENVKGIFIVATQRERPPENREKIPDRQITIAKKLNILVIRTEELLKVFEAYMREEVTTNELIEQFKTQVGEYKYNKE